MSTGYKFYTSAGDTTATTGTGTITLAGSAPTGYRTITGAASNADKLVCRIESSDKSEWEVAKGVYTSSGTTFSRDTVLASSNGGALVNFSAGTKNVYVVQPAEYYGAGLVDLNNVWTVIDDDVADTLIPDTTKPASPQYTRTINSGDIPSNNNVADYFVFFSIGGKNTDVSTRTINWRFTLNGVDIGAGDTSASVTTGSPFWRAGGQFALAAIAAGDVVGVKLWASVANVIDYRYVTIYVVPRFLVIGASQIGATIGGSSSTLTVAGAISGVTYQTVGLSANILDSATNSNVNYTPSSQNSPLIFGAGSKFSYNVVTNNNNQNGGASNLSASASLYSLSILIRYIRTFGL